MRALPFLLALLAAAPLHAGAFEDYDSLFLQLKPTEEPLVVNVEPAQVPGAAVAIQPLPITQYRDVDPTFASYGVEVGDPGPEVALFELDGERTSVLRQLERPTLFVSVSLTCPIARDSIPRAAEVAERFRGVVDVKLVYVVEAHPTWDPSPYVGTEWPSDENTLAGILYRQPTTMGVRIAMAEELQRRVPSGLPLLVDGGENEWWQAYGPAPNNAVLLSAMGEVLVEHGWFDGDGLDIVGDIERAFRTDG